MTTGVAQGRWPWVLILLVLLAVNVAVFASVEEYAYVGHMTVSEVWTLRMSMASALLLADNLCVLWWYSTLTRRIAEASTEQLRITSEQREDEVRPCVVLEWHEQENIASNVGGPITHRTPTYVARNIGRGLALNALHIEDLNAATLTKLHLGALESGQSVPLPVDLKRRLEHEATVATDRKRHVVIAEPVGGSEWTVTENLVEAGGRLSHRIRTQKLLDVQVAQIHRQTLTEYVDANWPSIQADLREMLGHEGRQE